MVARILSLWWAPAALAACSSPPPLTADPATCDVPVTPAAAVAPAQETLSAPAVKTEVIAGDVVAWDALGRRARLTSEGVDAAATLAPDGRHIAFLRSRRAASDVRDLHEVDVLSGEPELLVEERSGGDGSPCDLARWMGEPEYSLDGTLVHFSAFNGQLGAVCAVARATREVHWVFTGVERELIRSGPYRGHFLALRLEQDRLAGPRREVCYVLHSFTGDALRRLPCGGDALGRTVRAASVRKAAGS